MVKPHFLGIGAQKAGTTWLYYALAHHPEIFMPDCKEVHFWDQHYAKGYAWYEALFEGSGVKQVTGEITPAYGILPSTTIAEIAQRYPQLKLVYMVREPAARAWSAAMMDHGKEGHAYADTPDAWFIDHFRSEGSRLRTDYAGCIQRWLTHFPKKQLLILDYASIRKDPRGMLKRVAGHIGVDAGFFDILAEEHLARPRNEGSGQKIRPSLEPVLQELYAGNYDDFREFMAKENLSFFSASGQ